MSTSAIPAAPRIHALIPCAGHGSRAKTALPKQYEPVAGQALVWHTLAAFLAPQLPLAQVLLVLAPDDGYFENVPVPANLPATATRLQRSHTGGGSRAETVRNGLRALLAQGAHAEDWVLVHDAARCLITPELIHKLIHACLRDAVGGLLALPVADTLKAAAPGSTCHARITSTLPRNDKWLAQTPQMFRLGALLAALDAGLQTAPETITDEASAMEAQGHAPLLVPGSAWNFKVTYPEDFALAEAVLGMRQAG